MNYISVTDKALNQVLLHRPSGEHQLNIMVESGGCSGLAYKMDFIDSVNNNSVLIYHSDNINIYTSKQSLLYLTNIILDFSDGLNGKGFEYKNPNATRTCGCGMSFGV
ncbi:MAG TPA: iron-sulfur cluster assembly accessory protein [Candidatus Paceibacterota bacterium]|nr:iron-sulfur cluster assembly accessory protein [Candidatus Paceibacterota bacterium]